MSKTTLYIYTSNPEEYLREGEDASFVATHYDNWGDDENWFLLGKAEVELNANRELMVESITRRLDKEKSDLLAKVELLERKKEELLAIEHKPQV